MTQRLLLGVLVLASVVCAQRRVDPKNMYHRVICVVELVGQGTQNDPIRPKYAPAPGADQNGIIGYTYVLSDDNKYAIAEFVAKDRAALDEIVRGSLKAFTKGKAPRAEIETELRKYKKDFNSDQFGVVIP